MNFIGIVIAQSAFLIGLVGIIIIFIGASKGLFSFFHRKNFSEIRHEIGSHIILGLDFLVGKDIIDTFLLDSHNPEKFWMDLAGLITVVAIRITLTHFMLREVRDLENQKLKKHTSRTS